MIITAIRKTAFIGLVTAGVLLGGQYVFEDLIVEWQEQAEIETALTKDLARLEVQAQATAQAQQATLTALEIAQKELELTIKTQDAKRENTRQEASLTHSLNRESQLAWVWTGSQGIWYGLVGVVPCAIGGLIVWRVIERKRIEDEDRKLIQVMASGSIPVSREFMLNEPEKMFEWATYRAEMEARAKLARAEKVDMPSLTTITHSPTYSPTNDKELLLMSHAQDQQKKIEAQSTELTERDHAIKDTLESLGVPVAVSTKAIGPQVETYAVKPLHRLAKGKMKRVTVREITKYESDIAMALGVQSVRMEQRAGYIACEVARVKREFVNLTDLISSQGWKDARNTMNLPLALGRSTINEDVYMDLTEAPHMFVGGATKMGKSVLVRSIIYSLCQLEPSRVKLVMVDPKGNEFTKFACLPHVQKLITDMEMASDYLESAIDEMERRNALFAAEGVQKIEEYNAIGKDKLHYIVVIIDEVADLVMTNKDTVTDSLVRLAQKARSAGIHLLLATQRPDAEIIPPLVRANVMARISVKTRTSADSKVILDSGGAEKLLNCGDAIIDSDDYNMMRFQSAFIEMKQAVSDILLTHSANSLKFPVSGNQAETKRKPKVDDCVAAETKPLMETKELREKRIIQLHKEGLTRSEIQVEVWGNKGGRRNKERKQEIDKAIANVRFNGHLNGHHA